MTNFFEAGRRFLEKFNNLGDQVSAEQPFYRERGDKNNLRKLLSEYPQERDGKVWYLLAGGVSVEVVTGWRDDRQDIDIIVFPGQVIQRVGIDVVTPDRLWFGLSFNEEVLRSTSFKGKLNEREVWCVNPYLTYLSKLIIKNPRPQDKSDLIRLERFLQDNPRNLEEPLREKMFNLFNEEQQRLIKERVQNG